MLGFPFRPLLNWSDRRRCLERFLFYSAPFLAVIAVSDIDPAMEGFLTFWTFVIILQIIIPISLYITIEMVKMAEVYLIHSDPLMQDKEKGEGVRCKSFNITEDLGQVEHAPWVGQDLEPH